MPYILSESKPTSDELRRSDIVFVHLYMHCGSVAYKWLAGLFETVFYKTTSRHLLVARLISV